MLFWLWLLLYIVLSHMISNLPDDPKALENWIEEQEDQVPNLKDSARATIEWADPEKKNKTKCALVYLHGFKASHSEGDPVHRNVARYFGWNLYLARLEGHGLDIDRPLVDFQTSSLQQSAIRALEIGKKLGENVVVMGTSTGGSLGIFLAAHSEYNERIKALILYSPLIKFYGSSQWLLGNRWGRYLLQFIPGRQYLLTSQTNNTEAENEIWYHSYALQGALALGRFIQTWMNSSTFKKINIPLFAGYYYKNTKLQDKVVSVHAIKKMFRKVATTEPQKVLKNYPNSRTHVISSGLISKNITEITEDTINFLTQNMENIMPYKQQKLL